jgi:threonine/homoserine/homoserine lactone efflux protein
MTDPVWFVLTALGLLIAPGPTNALLANIGADNNARRLPALLAMLLGYAITISIVGFALAPLLRAQPWLGTALKLTSSAYLLTLAVRLWRRPQHGESNVNSISWRQVFTTTLLNPKGLVFALAVIPFGNPMVAEYLGVFAVWC